MPFSLTSPVTGTAISGLTSPTYTLTSDVGPTNASKQWAVTALGGTQSGVLVHSAGVPFTITFKRPPRLRVLGLKNPVTGQYQRIQVNEYQLLIRKGAAVQTDQYSVAYVDVKIGVPAGVDLFDSVQLKAMISCLGGVLSQQAQGISDTLATGII